MKIAVMLYGYFYIDGLTTLSRAPHSLQQLKQYNFAIDGYSHFLKSIYDPLVQNNNNVDVFMITHEFDHPNFNLLKKSLITTCKNFKIHFTNKIESPQLPYTYYNLIRHVKKTSEIEYDRYIITRNDLSYKSPITSWMPQFSGTSSCWYLFKDHEHFWNTEQKISDIIFIIDTDITSFQKCVFDYIVKNPDKTELHEIYPILKYYFGTKLNPIIDGFYDSNTAKKHESSCNPIYKMINRPYYYDHLDAHSNMVHNAHSNAHSNMVHNAHSNMIHNAHSNAHSNAHQSKKLFCSFRNRKLFNK